MTPTTSTTEVLTLHNFDELIEVLTGPTGNKDVDDILRTIIEAVNQMKIGQKNLVAELLTMYDSASEHNVDIGRDAIYALATRIAAVDAVSSNPDANPSP